MLRFDTTKLKGQLHFTNNIKRQVIGPQKQASVGVQAYLYLFSVNMMINVITDNCCFCTSVQ